MKADYEFEEKLFLQLNTEEIDLLDSAITKIKNNSSKIGFRKSIVNKEETHLLDTIQIVIKEMREVEEDDSSSGNKQ